MSQIFRKQIAKPTLKPLTSNFILQKRQFDAQFEILSKTKYVNSFKIFRWAFVSKKIFIEAFKYQKHTKFI